MYIMVLVCIGYIYIYPINYSRLMLTHHIVTFFVTMISPVTTYDVTYTPYINIYVCYPIYQY